MDNINTFLQHAVEIGASDLFIAAGKAPAFRVNGEVVTDSTLPALTDDELTAFRQSRSGAAARRDYDANGACDISYNSAAGRFRINFFDTVSGGAAAIRPIRSGNKLALAELNLPPELNALARLRRGLVLITGSTGCGKSTTLAALVNAINRERRAHILTIEDPIEFIHTDEKSVVSQREINSDAVSFNEALRSAMRENPDVIVIGELRDAETVETAVAAALTGHLVLGTLHTADSVLAVERLINLFPERRRETAAIDIGLALEAICAQQLVPAIDGKMRPVTELLIATPTVRKLISEADYGALEEALKQGGDSGMTTFNRAAFRLYRDGILALETARNAAGNPEGFDLLVKGMESGVDVFRNHYGAGLEADAGQLIDMHMLLRSALKNGASDLHLSSGSAPMLRVDGVLRPLDLPPLTGGDIQRLLFSVVNRNQRVELEEKRELDFALSVSLKLDGKFRAIRFRINGFYQRGQLGVVARVVNSSIPQPKELHLVQPIVDLVLNKRQGLVLVTGPTGSGKTTTLASLIDQINRSRSAHVITIEDPIEYVHSNINSIIEQRELHSDTLSFSTALKYALRQDPDVIMVGELRDVETIAAAITAAETGHLVLATIHTNSAPQTIDRIVDSFPAYQQNQIRLQLAGSLLGVVSQRLLPRRKQPGRIAAFEVMLATPPVQALVREGKTHQLQSVIETSAKDGMMTLEKSLEELCSQGEVTVEDTRSYQADYKQVASF
ncbi:MAG: PilT/PilU family type 4a pilus ATPase [Victivallaceae bacterium]|nr:PilT/PilU family type 4a pilus ATPase [Victivallaceae bacterium]